MRKKKRFGLFENKLKDYTKYIFIVIVGLLIFFSVRNILRIQKASEKISNAEERVEQIKKENEELIKRLEETKSEYYLEKQLRDNLGLARKGETVIVLPDEEELQTNKYERVEEEDTLPPPNWRLWLDLFL